MLVISNASLLGIKEIYTPSVKWVEYAFDELCLCQVPWDIAYDEDDTSMLMVSREAVG